MPGGGSFLIDNLQIFKRIWDFYGFLFTSSIFFIIFFYQIMTRHCISFDVHLYIQKKFKKNLSHIQNLMVAHHKYLKPVK